MILNQTHNPLKFKLKQDFECINIFLMLFNIIRHFYLIYPTPTYTLHKKIELLLVFNETNNKMENIEKPRTIFYGN